MLVVYFHIFFVHAKDEFYDYELCHPKFAKVLQSSLVSLSACIVFVVASSSRGGAVRIATRISLMAASPVARIPPVVQLQVFGVQARLVVAFRTRCPGRTTTGWSIGSWRTGWSFGYRSG